MSHVFISYSKKNRDYARKLADHLLSLGFDVWIDDRIDYGSDWWRTIVRAIRSASAIIVIMTEDSDSSEWVQREVTIADKGKIPPFPLWLSGDFNASDNWAIYVRTQYADVTDGSLPRDDFYERLAQAAPQKPVMGKNVTPRVAEDFSTITDPELALEIANPPAPDTLSVPRVARPSTRGINSGILVAVVAGIVVVLLVAFTFLSRAPSSTPTETPTHTQQVAHDSTQLPTATSTKIPTITLTPTPLPTLSSTEIEGTIQGEMGNAETDIANTQSAVIALETANAVATDARSAADQTATATQWTLTPTIDARATALARINETQVAATQSILDRTATAASWTDTPTPTSTPTFTDTPTATPTATLTLTPMLTSTPSATPFICPALPSDSPSFAGFIDSNHQAESRTFAAHKGQMISICLSSTLDINVNLTGQDGKILESDRSSSSSNVFIDGYVVLEDGNYTISISVINPRVSVGYKVTYNIKDNNGTALPTATQKPVIGRL